MTTQKNGSRSLRLVATCRDRIGIVAAVASHLAERGASISEADQYHDPSTSTFFMRYVFDAPGGGTALADFRTSLRSVAETFDMEWRLVETGKPQRVVILVSKYDHCLSYLLQRRNAGDLPFEIPCVISNHEDLRDLVEWYRIPYHHVPVPKNGEEKRAAFEKTAELIDGASPDTVVLARYMQIFPPWLCERYRHRVINIHHSFLPSFVGARPYHQAEQRGVKLIGATCHYVTEDLDAGPIIDQDVARIRHSDTIRDMVRIGKDIETTVLARGLRYHLEGRVLVHRNKTILFE